MQNFPDHLMYHPYTGAPRYEPFVVKNMVTNLRGWSLPLLPASTMEELQESSMKIIYHMIKCGWADDPELPVAPNVLHDVLSMDVNGEDFKNFSGIGQSIVHSVKNLWRNQVENYNERVSLQYLLRAVVNGGTPMQLILDRADPSYGRLAYEPDWETAKNLFMEPELKAQEWDYRHLSEFIVENEGTPEERIVSPVTPFNVACYPLHPMHNGVMFHDPIGREVSPHMFDVISVEGAQNVARANGVKLLEV